MTSRVTAEAWERNYYGKTEFSFKRDFELGGMSQGHETTYKNKHSYWSQLS